MVKVMKPGSLSGILRRAAGEYKAKSSIFEIPAALFDSIFEIEAESPGLAVMSGRASIPVGPAAGPHTQIAPNILAAYLAGARVFELKTVQIKDRLELEKPCIDALDEGQNVEWSTELSLDGAEEYRTPGSSCIFSPFSGPGSPATFSSTSRWATAWRE